MKITQTALIISALAFAGTASATAITTPGLQAGLDDLVVNGVFFDVNSSQHNPDEMWQVEASTSSANTLLFEFAGFDNQASFGIYDLNDTDKKLMIFDNTSTGTNDDNYAPNNWKSSLEFDPFAANYTFSTKFGTQQFSSYSYGYYLTSGNGTFYSQAALNGDSDNNGVADDHMVAYRGDGKMKLDITGNNGAQYSATFGESSYILAWEDLNFAGADFDYADFVVYVESVTSVFEPGSMALIGLGLAGLAASRRRQKGLTA